MGYQGLGVQAVVVSVDWFRGGILLEPPNRNIVLLALKPPSCDVLYGGFLRAKISLTLT